MGRSSNCEDLFGSDLTPLSDFERIALLIDIPKPDPALKHCMVSNQPLCQQMHEDNPTSLSGEVNCLVCRKLWHFKVSPESYRARIGYTSKSIFTRYFNIMACNCLECEIIKPNIWQWLTQSQTYSGT